MTELTREQNEAITCDTSLAVIASAGTGKTSVLTGHLVHLLKQKNVSLSNILAFTYTQKAAREMQQRVLRLAELPLGQVTQLGVSTIHAFLTRLLKRFGSRVGLANDFTVLEDFAFLTWLDLEVRTALKTALDSHDPIVLSTLNRFGSHRTRMMLTRLMQEKNLLSPQDEIRDFLLWSGTLLNELRQKRVERGTLSFSDLESLSLELLQTCPDVKAELIGQYRHILLDECQDTAPIQFEIICHLFDPKKNTLFIVGDPKQSIYGFREADTNLFYRLTRMIRDAGGRELWLTRTFRTPERVQKQFNAVFPELLNTDDETLFEETLSEKRDENAGIYVHPVAADDPDTPETLARNVTELIKNLLDTGVNPSDIAILSTTRGKFCQLESVFKEQNIPYVTVSRSRHFMENTVSLLFHVFLYLAGIRDKITGTGILHNPLMGFDETEIASIIALDQEDLFLLTEKTDNSPSNGIKTKERFLNLKKALSRLKFLGAHLTPPELLKSVIHELRSFWPDQRLSTHELFLTREFSLILESWQRQGFDTLIQILPLLKLWEQSESDFKLPETDRIGVNLLTIHQAKGLEFDHVILIPSGRPRSNTLPYIRHVGTGLLFKKSDEHNITTIKPMLEESEDYTLHKDHLARIGQREITRLVYVALTRTQKNLYLFPPKPKKDHAAKLAKGTLKTAEIKSYNEWLIWLAARAGGMNHAPALPSRTDTIHGAPLFAPQTGVMDHTPAGHSRTDAIHDIQSQAMGTLQRAPTRYTPTELETFFTCPKKFELKHGHHIDQHFLGPGLGTGTLQRAPTHPNNVSAVERGNIIHEILQFYDPARDNLAHVVEQALFNQHITDSSGEILNLARDLVQKIESDQKLSDLLFGNHDSRQEIPFTLGFNNFHINGQIDRLVNVSTRENPRWQIVDYKTHHIHSGMDRDRLAQSFELQMACYALAVHQNFGQDSVRATLLFTHDASHHSFEFSHEDFSRWQDLLENLVKKIGLCTHTGSFPFTTDPVHCRHCPYFGENACGVKNHAIDSN